MRRFIGVWIVLGVVIACSIAIGCATDESEYTGNATGSGSGSAKTCKSEDGDVTPEQCRANQQKACDEDDELVRKNLKKGLTQKCWLDCADKAADLQKRLCERDIGPAVESCEDGNVCLCEGVIGGALDGQCGSGPLCRDIYMIECTKKCKNPDYDFDPENTECSGEPMDPPPDEDPPNDPPPDGGTDGGGSGSGSGSGG